MTMEKEIKGLSDYLDILRRRKYQLILPALMIFIASAALVLTLPSIYRSSATILIEQQEIPQDLVRTTVSSYADQRIQLISQRVMTNANLGKIIEAYDLYPGQRKNYSLYTVVEKLRKDINLEMLSADFLDVRSGRPREVTIAFTLSFDSKSPELAKNVVNEMASLYLDENIKARAKAAKETSTFLTEEAGKLSERVNELEAKLAEFKENNVGNLPDMLQLNLQQMERIERQLTENDQQVRTLEDRRIYLQTELAQISPYSEVYSATGRRIMSTGDELKNLQMQYVSLAAQYNENHPKLIIMREKIAALKQEVGGSHDQLAMLKAQLTTQKYELEDLSDRYSDKHPEVEKLKRAIADTVTALKLARRQTKINPQEEMPLGDPDNPNYIQLKIQLEAAEAEIRSLRQTRKELQVKLSGYEQRLISAPQVEREYKILNRDYENAMAMYKEIKDKQMEAELAEAMEIERKGERFSLIEPPLLPEKPIKPNRVAMLLLGFVLSFAGGIGNIAIRESMDQTVHGAKGVIAITQAPPLAVIPYIENDQDHRKRLTQRILLVLTVVFIVAAFAAAVQFLFKPQDAL
jgi:uncharacterized protein involved in exopolysaccharide biosynthesis